MASKSLQVENAILADLENMSPRPFYIERFEGPFSEEVLARWLAGVQKPSVAVFYSGGKQQRTGRGDADDSAVRSLDYPRPAAGL